MLEPSSVSAPWRAQYSFRSVCMLVAAMRPDRRCNPSSARRMSFGSGVEIYHQASRLDDDDSVPDRLERCRQGRSLRWAKSASLSCVRRACCRCGTRPLINFTRSGVSNDSERRGDATTKHDVVVRRFSRTKRPSSSPLGRIQSAWNSVVWLRQNQLDRRRVLHRPDPSRQRQAHDRGAQ